MFGSWPLRKITTRAIQLWFNSGNPKQIKGEPNIVEKSPETRANVLAILSNIFSKARAWECHEAPNPCEHVELGRKYAVRPKVLLSSAQVDMLLEILPPDVRLAAEICDVTGCRISEVLGLQERHIDLTNGTAVIEQAWRRGDLAPVTKSDRGVRVVPLLDVADEIAQRMTGRPSRFLFDNGSGEPTDDREMAKALRAAMKRLRLWKEGTGFHSLRRRAITEWQQAGATTAETARMAGHSPRMVLDYTVADVDRAKDLAQKRREKGRVN